MSDNITQLMLAEQELLGAVAMASTIASHVANELRQIYADGLGVSVPTVSRKGDAVVHEFEILSAQMLEAGTKAIKVAVEQTPQYIHAVVEWDIPHVNDRLGMVAEAGETDKLHYNILRIITNRVSESVFQANL